MTKHRDKLTPCLTDMQGHTIYFPLEVPVQPPVPDEPQELGNPIHWCRPRPNGDGRRLHKRIWSIRQGERQFILGECHDGVTRPGLRSPLLRVARHDQAGAEVFHLHHLIGFTNTPYWYTSGIRPGAVVPRDEHTFFIPGTPDGPEAITYAVENIDWAMAIHVDRRVAFLVNMVEAVTLMPRFPIYCKPFYIHGDMTLNITRMLADYNRGGWGPRFGSAIVEMYIQGPQVTARATAPAEPPFVESQIAVKAQPSTLTADLRAKLLNPDWR